jgi:soluble lytic murein transglycosylase-like protein
MRLRRSILLTTPIVLLLAAAPASAAVSHTVQPGETLWSIAAANNLTTRTVAAFNGLSENAQVVLGSTINVPTVAEGASALSGAAAPQATAAAAPAAATGGGAPAVLGSYVVRSGDTLGALARNAGVALDTMAAANGLDPARPLLIGTVLKLPAGAPAPARASEPLPAQRVVSSAGPQPTPQRVGAADIQSVASQYGVSPSLAAAIGWQESGFNNGMVSDANARGVMQVMPGTWSYVESLSGQKLNSASATDNVRAGVLYLQHLLKQTGGDENAAIAGYYQGLGSVQSRGLFDDTQKYVANVQALRSRFGG